LNFEPNETVAVLSTSLVPPPSLQFYPDICWARALKNQNAMATGTFII